MTPQQPTAATTTTAAIVIIGNEVLSGKVVDENTPYLVKELRGLGVRVARVVIIPDVPDEIAREVRWASERYTWVFTAGGLGPTHDDVTMAAIAQAFDVALEPHPELVARIDALKRGRTGVDSLARLAWVPANASLYWGDGERHWPTVQVGNVTIFPGVPRFLRERFDLMRSLLQSSRFHGRVVCLRVVESSIVTHIDATVAAFPDVDIGSYPLFPEEREASEVRTKLTFDSKDEARAEAAARDLIARLEPGSVVGIDAT